MIAMTPVLARGYTFWDRAIFPRDEFEERTRFVQGNLKSDQLAGVIVWSQGYHTNGDLAFLSGNPTGGAVLVTEEGEPSLIVSGGGREQYFLRMQTWIEDMHSTGGGLGKSIAESLKRRGVHGGTLGVVGFDLMSAGAKAELAESLSGFGLIDYEPRYRELRTAKRPRELLAVKASLDIAREAVSAGEQVFINGGTNAQALVESERIARRLGARDFRALSNLEGTQLRPLERITGSRIAPLILWVAVDHYGYWAEAVNGSACRAAASRAVDAMISSARPGIEAGEVARAGLAELPIGAREGALSYGLGSGCGLSLEETPSIEPDSKVKLIEGALLTLRACVMEKADASLCSAVVQVGAADTIRL
jgi:Xaa-Pro aminopeptidase